MVSLCCILLFGVSLSLSSLYLTLRLLCSHYRSYTFSLFSTDLSLLSPSFSFFISLCHLCLSCVALVLCGLFLNLFYCVLSPSSRFSFVLSLLFWLTPISPSLSYLFALSSIHRFHSCLSSLSSLFALCSILSVISYLPSLF